MARLALPSTAVCALRCSAAVFATAMRSLLLHYCRHACMLVKVLCLLPGVADLELFCVE